MHISDIPEVKGVIKSPGKPTAVIIEVESLRSFLSKIKWEGLIDEEKYIKKYQDVANAIRDGKIKSATSHYARSGVLEQREADIVS